jgi:hypothetical protein
MGHQELKHARSYNNAVTFDVDVEGDFKDYENGQNV